MTNSKYYEHRKNGFAIFAALVVIWCISLIGAYGGDNSNILQMTDDELRDYRQQHQNEPHEDFDNRTDRNIAGSHTLLPDIVITQNNNPYDLANAILSLNPGITITAATFTGDPTAAGLYSGGPFNISDGIILASGDVLNALPPDESPGMTTDFGLPGCEYCDDIIPGYYSYDAAIFEITFDACDACSSISFDFIFGSEEYPEYVGSSYNDVLGAYLNGNQIAFDGTGAPITINGPFFSGAYVQTPPENGLEYDGSTLKLTTTAPITPGSSGNTLVVVVCDAGDFALDSGVLLANLQGSQSSSDTCTGVAPDFDHPPTPNCDQTIYVNVSEEVTFDVQASDIGPNDDTVTLTVAGIPSGAYTTPVLPVSGNPVSCSFSWTPSLGDIGNHTIVFTATDAELCHLDNECTINIYVQPPGSSVSCMESSTDPVLVPTPAGSHPFVVTLRDAFGDVIEGSSDVWVEITNYGGLELCSTQVVFPALPAIAPSDADGNIAFYLAAGNCVPGCQAVVQSSCGIIATVPVRCVDASGDLFVSPAGDFTGDLACSDFDDDGFIDADDQNIFNLYLWQLCGDPCAAYNLSIAYEPEDSLTVGTYIDVQSRFENTTTEPCSLISITFYASCFGAGSEMTAIGSETVNFNVLPGWSYIADIADFPVPACGLGCLIAEANIFGCDAPLIVETCPQIVFECTPEAGQCYLFKTWFVEQSYVFVDPPVSLAPGFIIAEEPSEGWYNIDDTIRIDICHTYAAVIQDSIIYRFYVSDDDVLSPDDDRYVNKVVVRANNGDVTGDCFVDIDDVVFLIEYIFASGDAPEPLQLGNVNCSEDIPVDIDDVVYLINYIFGGGPPPGFCPELW